MKAGERWPSQQRLIVAGESEPSMAAIGRELGSALIPPVSNRWFLPMVSGLVGDILYVSLTGIRATPM